MKISRATRIKLGGLLVLAAAAALALYKAGGVEPAAGAGSVAAVSTSPASAMPAAQSAKQQELPDESALLLAGEAGTFQLWVDPASAHFKVVSKHTGRSWRSYPVPEQWSKETLTGTWRNNLLSPVILEFVDVANFKSQSKIVNWREDEGVLEGFELIPGGYRATYQFTRSGFTLPVEVRLGEGYVETKIVDSGVREGELSLLNVKLYPLFGAALSGEQEGYMLVPDGSGALIRFKENRTNDTSVYKESVYGADAAFFEEETARKPVRMPVYGIKTGEQAFVAILTGGEAYAKVFAAPSGAFGSFNWATAEWQYRSRFFQNTTRKGNTGFFTYNAEPFLNGGRSTRYYLLEGDDSDYAGMAGVYRSYLMAEKGLEPIVSGKPDVPLYLDLIGADSKEGLLWDEYLPATTTDQAREIVNHVYDSGIEHLIVQYAGWQRGGYSAYGGLFPVDSRLGGNKGMKSFIDDARAKDIPVYLTANYALNNTGRDSFRDRYNGLRNLAGSLQKLVNPVSGEEIQLASPRFSSKVLHADLADYRSLGAAGIYFTGGTGSAVNSDYNSRYQASREEVLGLQHNDLRHVREMLGGASVEDANFFFLDQIGHIHHMVDDYSFDLFVDEAVPFAQIALHGLVTYTSNWLNLPDEQRVDFLRTIEYGAYPSYVFTGAPSGRLKNAYSIWYYSTNYRDWQETVQREYREINEALRDVQGQFITAHRTLAPGVKETVYGNGTSIMVNYNAEPYASGSIRIPARGYLVRTGGNQS